MEWECCVIDTLSVGVCATLFCAAVDTVLDNMDAEVCALSADWSGAALLGDRTPRPGCCDSDRTRPQQPTHKEWIIRSLTTDSVLINPDFRQWFPLLKGFNPSVVHQHMHISSWRVFNCVVVRILPYQAFARRREPGWGGASLCVSLLTPQRWMKRLRPWLRTRRAVVPAAERSACADNTPPERSVCAEAWAWCSATSLPDQR